jgi:hypothetical protein
MIETQHKRPFFFVVDSATRRRDWNRGLAGSEEQATSANDCHPGVRTFPRPWFPRLIYLGREGMASITTTDVRSYVSGRQNSGAAAATINRELAAFKKDVLSRAPGRKAHQPAAHSDFAREQHPDRILRAT